MKTPRVYTSLHTDENLRVYTSLHTDENLRVYTSLHTDENPRVYTSLHTDKRKTGSIQPELWCHKINTGLNGERLQNLFP